MPRSSHGPGTPPSTPVINCSRLLCYAIVDHTVQFSGRTLLFVDGKELGQVPCLAICENKKLSDVLLFHCDSKWNTLGCSGHQSVAEAKAKAERIYAGISALWVDAGISKQTAEAYLNRQFGSERCSFCGKRPDQVDQMWQETRRDRPSDRQSGQRKQKVRICDRCVTGFYDTLPK